MWLSWGFRWLHWVRQQWVEVSPRTLRFSGFPHESTKASHRWCDSRSIEFFQGDSAGGVGSWTEVTAAACPTVSLSFEDFEMSDRSLFCSRDRWLKTKSLKSCWGRRAGGGDDALATSQVTLVTWEVKQEQASWHKNGFWTRFVYFELSKCKDKCWHLHALILQDKTYFLFMLNILNVFLSISIYSWSFWFDAGHFDPLLDCALDCLLFSTLPPVFAPLYPVILFHSNGLPDRMSLESQCCDEDVDEDGEEDEQCGCVVHPV